MAERADVPLDVDKPLNQSRIYQTSNIFEYEDEDDDEDETNGRRESPRGPGLSRRPTIPQLLDDRGEKAKPMPSLPLAGDRRGRADAEVLDGKHFSRQRREQ